PKAGTPVNTSFERNEGLYPEQLFNLILGEDKDAPARDANGLTALMYAARVDSFDTLRSLLRYAPEGSFASIYDEKNTNGEAYIDWCDSNGYTALMHASNSGHLRSINYLINAGAEPEFCCKVARFDALQLALNGGHSEAVKAIERRLSKRSKFMTIVSHPATTLFFGIMGGLTLPTILRFIARTLREYRELRSI
ncbi:ankyrin repeat domain-containing protein, partial [Akkermansiaceae bacterium]|nr:ankyrin repeat domain-containing protein [Akkermansiaceae bacterium]